MAHFSKVLRQQEQNVLILELQLQSFWITLQERCLTHHWLCGNRFSCCNVRFLITIAVKICDFDFKSIHVKVIFLTASKKETEGNKWIITLEILLAINLNGCSDFLKRYDQKLVFKT